MGRRDAARYSKQGWGSVFLALTFLILGGCKCTESKDKQREEDLARLPKPSGTLQDQFAAELAARPGGTGTLEGLIEGLTKEGITFNAPRQPFARKQLALYCNSVDSTDGMIMTVCEYPSPEQAKRGQAESEQLGKLTAGYQSRVSKKSVLQLISRSDTPPEHVAKVLRIFDGL